LDGGEAWLRELEKERERDWEEQCSVNERHG